MTITSEGQRQRALAAAYEAEAVQARARAASFDRGDEGESQIASLLAPLVHDGWTVLHKRVWPGTRRGDIDHVLVGPGGIVVLDAKNWSGELHLENGRLHQGQADRSDELTKVASQLAFVEEIVAEYGVAPLAVTAGMVFLQAGIGPAVAGRIHLVPGVALLRWLRALPRRFDEEAVARLSGVLAEELPPYVQDVRVVPAITRRAQPRRPDPGLFEVEDLDLAALEAAVALDLESWMVWLHPAQLEVVRKTCNGPSRVRGPAGCGKSVVALHRTAYLLAHDPGDALIVTFVKTLPAVLHTLYTRLAPLSAARVHVSGMHALAWRIVKDAGVRFDLDLVAAETAFNVAWAQVGRRVLETPDLPRSYWQEEVCSVIKGRGLSDFEDYAALVRTGRRTSLRVSQRQAVWDLYVRYQELLADKRKHDFQDLVALALDVAQRGAARRYRFVVVDEAQDLDLQSIRLLAELVSDERDGLTLVGDGQQAVYAGGYTLKEAGLTVTGRSTVLQVNYRNTKQILDAAAQFVRADDFDDLEELARDGDSPVQVVREGTGVLDVRASDSDSARVALVRQLQVDQELPVRSAAVLCRTRKEAGELVSLLRREGLPVLALEDYDGTPSDAIKVGTAKRAKGLEFSRVYVPRVDSWLTQDGSAEQERVQRERRELYVAMTRARDGLWRCRVEPPAA